MKAYPSEKITTHKKCYLKCEPYLFKKGGGLGALCPNLKNLLGEDEDDQSKVVFTFPQLKSNNMDYKTRQNLVLLLLGS